MAGCAGIRSEFRWEPDPHPNHAGRCRLRLYPELGSPQTLSIVSNHSDPWVRIPGKMRSQGVAVHPSPTEKWSFDGKALSWGAELESPDSGCPSLCGNGVEWSLKWQRGSLARTLSSGRTHGDQVSASQSSQALPVQPGDVVSLGNTSQGWQPCLRFDRRTWELIDPQHPENLLELERGCCFLLARWQSTCRLTGKSSRLVLSSKP